MYTSLQTTHTIVNQENLTSIAQNSLHNRYVLIDPQNQTIDWHWQNNDLEDHYTITEHAKENQLIYSDEFNQPEEVIPYLDLEEAH